MNLEKIRNFLFEVHNESSTVPMQSQVSIICLYTIFMVSFVAVPLNVIRDFQEGTYLMVIAESVFLVLITMALGSFLWTRSLRMVKNIVSVAVSILALGLIIHTGGVRGFGFLYFVAGFSIMFHVIGVRGGVFLPLFLFFGALFQVWRGAYGPQSIFNDPALTWSYLSAFFIASLLGVISVIYQHSLVRHLSRAAYLDPVTTLANRTKIEEYLNEMVPQSERRKRNFSVLGVKILNFHRINANLGSSLADEVLTKLAKRLNLESPPKSLTGRYSGTLFILISPLNKIEELVRYGHSLELKLEDPILIDGNHVSIQTELAVTRYPQDGVSGNKLLSNLMATLNRKGSSDGQISFYDEEHFASEQKQFILSEDLKMSIIRNELTLVYHPKIRLSDDSCQGAEILLRWKSEKYGAVGPDIFIPLAEQSGFIKNITRWVLEQSFKELGELQNTLGSLKGLGFAINLSPIDLTDETLPEFINHTHKIYGLSPENLEFEITEGILMGQNPTVQKVLDSLRDWSFRLAIDDFGTGYSSLSYLHRLRVNNLKIDQSFIRPLGETNANYQIVDAIISMGKSLELDITAEGVETKFQEGHLKLAGCTYAQGWLYSKPVPMKEFHDWLIGHKSLKKSKTLSSP